MQDLKGKVVIITGASTPQGIGRAIPSRVAAGGACFLGAAHPPAAQLAEASAECRANSHAGRVETSLVDLGKAGAAEQMIRDAHALFGRIDVLVNNAAIRSPYDFGDYTRDQFDASIAVNLAAPFFASQTVVPHMREQGGGRIIHIASQLGHVTYAQRALYGLTKAALIHLTKSMAYELGKDNILVNAISPGPIATQATLNRDPEVTRKRVEQYLPIGRVGTPEEIADLALYLATESPHFLQGQDIVIDGGYTIH
jgi:NAD(P)-dependent dehydrogenase (short-subunit alcohol dehydrogenase family)